MANMMDEKDGDRFEEASERFKKGKKKKKDKDALEEGKEAFMMKQMMGKKTKARM